MTIYFLFAISVSFGIAVGFIIGRDVTTYKYEKNKDSLKS